MQSFSTFLAAFDVQSSQNPQSIALVHNKQSWTYRELNLASEIIAQSITENGSLRNQVVALTCQRSLACIASMIVVMKTGAAFLPVDMTAPDERIKFLFDDADVTHIIADNDQSEWIHGLRLPARTNLTTLPNSAEMLASVSDAATSSADVTAASRAYVMYTSGSTGKPKGVVISHRALAHYCAADVEAYQLTPDDRTLQFSTLSFDISIEEIFPPLCIGSTVVLRPTERSAAQIELSDIIDTYSISALHIATGYWHEWVDLMFATKNQVPESLRLTVVTGEKVSPEHYVRWRDIENKPGLWINAYGPTEATVSATAFTPSVDWRGSTLPIGKPLPGYTAYILNENLEPVGDGVTGELYIGGPALSDGYLNRPELNREVFVTDPFSKSTDARLYKTGDLSRWMDDGNIEYAGRIDDQLKVGSYRIEPGEIENALNTHPNINESFVSATLVNDKKQLVAYVAVDDSRPSIAGIARHLSKTLPSYMLPSRYLSMPVMPKTVNGKIDRRGLPDVSLAVAPQLREVIAPSGESEQKLHEIWCRILGVADVSVHDSFISIGGDSLMAIDAILSIQKEFDFTVSTRDFFYLDTIASLAAHIEGKPVVQPIPAPVLSFINSRDRQLYSVVQHPNMMQNFARQGYTVMRFDWRGTANSSGVSSELDSLQPWVEDLEDAADYFSGFVNSMDIVCVRMGALIAAKTPLESTPVTGRYYWDPVESGTRWLEEMDELQNGILNDTFRYLFRRKKSAGPGREYAGLGVSDALKQALERESFASIVTSSNTNEPAHVLASSDSAMANADLSGVELHLIDEFNDWTSPRTITKDMVIHKVANRIADLLENDALAPST